MLLRLLGLACASGQLAEAEVAVGDEGAHAALAGERQRLAVGAFGVVRTLRGRDVTREAERMGLAWPSPQPTGQRQRLADETGGLVNPPGREVGHPRVQRHEPLVQEERATAELLDGARD